jgi:hypothetical protein
MSKFEFEKDDAYYDRLEKWIADDEWLEPLPSIADLLALSRKGLTRRMDALTAAGRTHAVLEGCTREEVTALVERLRSDAQSYHDEATELERFMRMRESKQLGLFVVKEGPKE